MYRVILKTRYFRRVPCEYVRYGLFCCKIQASASINCCRMLSKHSITKLLIIHSASHTVQKFFSLLYMAGPWILTTMYKHKLLMALPKMETLLNFSCYTNYITINTSNEKNKWISELQYFFRQEVFIWTTVTQKHIRIQFFEVYLTNFLARY